MAWVIVGILAVLTIALFLKQMRDAAVVNELRAARDEAQKDARRMAEKLKDVDQKMSRKDQELGTSKESKKQLQDAEAAKKAADAAKKTADDERSRVEERNRELSADLSRVRIEKEQQRQELVAARERLRELGAAAEQIGELKAAATRAQDQAREAEKRNESLRAEVAAAKPVVGETEEQREERQSTRLRKDVERLEKSVSKLEGVIEQWKVKALESESNSRHANKRLRDTQSLLNITQSQLDHALDEIHIMKFGEEPEHPQVDKAKKRAALKPKETTVEVLAGEIVVLPDLAADKAPEPAVVEAPKAEPVKVEAPKVAAPGPAPAKAEAPKAEAPKAEPKKAAKTDAKAKTEGAPVLRKKEPEPAAPKADDKAARPKAPPRPKK